MPGITESKVDEYMLSVLPPRDSVLQEMEAQAAERDIPIVGPAVGRVLFQYAQLINAKKFLSWARLSDTPRCGLPGP